MMNATLLAAERANPMECWLAEITHSSLVHRYSIWPGYASLASGVYENRILSIDPFQIRAADQGVTPLTANMRLRDTDRYWRKRRAGAAGDSIEGATAVIYRAHPVCAKANWSTEFTGEVRHLAFPEEGVARFELQVADQKFLAKVPSAKWEIRLSDWPGAAEDVVGRIAPLIYGKHASYGLMAQCAIPGLRVGAGDYLLSAGWLKAVDLVTNGTTPTSAYTVTHPLVGGRRYTLLDFTSDPGGSADIRADVQGYESVGDGSGTMISNPVDVVCHFVTNFVVNDYSTGAWYSTTYRDAIFDTTWRAIVAAYFTARAHVNSKIITEQADGYSLLNEWCESNKALLYWGQDGKLYFTLDNPCYAPAAYQTDPVLDWNRDLIGRLVHEVDDSDILSSITGSYLLIDGEAKQKLRIRGDLNVADKSPQTISLGWSPAYL